MDKTKRGYTSNWEGRLSISAGIDKYTSNSIHLSNIKYTLFACRLLLIINCNLGEYYLKKKSIEGY